MRMQFLGTSAGVPTKSRNTSALAVAIDNSRDWYLVDCGEATQHRLLHSPYSAARLRAIFISHVHGDHCFGLPGLIASAHMGGRTKPLSICAPDGIRQFVEAVIQHCDLGHLRYPIEFIRSDSPGFRFDTEDMQVCSHALSHRVPCYAYEFIEKPPKSLDQSLLEQEGIPRGPLWGKLQAGETVENARGEKLSAEQVLRASRPARRIIVGGDNDDLNCLREPLASAHVLVHEATFSEAVLAKVGPQYQHATAAMVAKAAAEHQLPNLVLTHFSQRYRPQHKDPTQTIDYLYQEARQYYRGNLAMAEDLQAYHLQSDMRFAPCEQSEFR